MTDLAEWVRQFIQIIHARRLPETLAISGTTANHKPFKIIFRKDRRTRAYEVGTPLWMRRNTRNINDGFLGHHRVPQTSNNIILGFERLMLLGSSSSSARGARLTSIESDLARMTFNRNGRLSSFTALSPPTLGAEQIRNGDAIPANNLVFENAILYEPLDPRNAHYITVNANNGRVRHVYSLATLDKLLRGDSARSPFTRKLFGKNQVARLRQKKK